MLIAIYALIYGYIPAVAIILLIAMLGGFSK